MPTASQKASIACVCPWNPSNSPATRAARSAFNLIAGAGILCVLLLAGCTSNTRTESTVALEEPKVANGVIVDPNDPAKLEELAAAVDALDLPKPQEMPAPDGAPQGDPNQNPAPGQADASPAKVSVAEAVDMTARQTLPPEATKLVTLPKLSRTEINEIIERLILELGASLGYTPGSTVIADALPNPPAGLLDDRTVVRSGDNGAYVLRFGCRYFASQPPQLWVQGVIVGNDNALSANPDLAQVEPQVTKVVTSLNEMRAALTPQDLQTKLIQLSYTDTATALTMLKSFGVTTMAKPTDVPEKVEFAKLPYVASIEDPKKPYTGLVGLKTATTGGKLSLAPGAASELEDNAIASPLTQLMVLFHPAHPEQYSEVRHLLDTFIDRPARQIFIDAMVLEISQTGLKDLGVEWDLRENESFPLALTGGALTTGGDSTLHIGIPDTSQLNDILEGSEFQWDWNVTINALLRSGKAEILSRPSVLTLNNRQSTIRVGEDIPIASSLQGAYGGNVSFQFEYIPTGILLNIRPRISEDGSEVSMLIDTIVSSKVPGKDLVLKSANSDAVLAAAPTVSTRRVQTYGRIPNNTPLIIGGLVARENTLTQDKIPVLGDLPLIGFAFRAEKNERLKREVIIVLTPHVLSDSRQARRSLPKDEDAFDSFGNDLFRDSYRIRSEDVFDLDFLLRNRRIATYRRLARQAAEKNYRLGAVEPFRSFVRDNVPGESILVARMIYEVIKRLNIADKIEPSGIIYFVGQEVGGYKVEFLEKLLKDRTEKGVLDFGDQALAITYHYDRASLEEGHLGSEPIPEIRLVDCPDRQTWSKLLWQMNQSDPNGPRQHTILIQNESDVMRLRRALALKRVVMLNGGTNEMRLQNFSVGKVLLMPELKKGQIQVVDADTAMFFFQTELYYAATLAEIEKQLKELDKVLRRPDIHILLDSSIPNIPDSSSSDEDK